MPLPEKISLDKAALLRDSWLADLPDDVVAEAAACGSLRLYADAELVHARGDACDGFYTIASGSVRFTRATVDGHTSTIAVLERHNWFGEISIFDGLPRTHDGHAYGPTILLFHARSDFKRLLMRHPAVYERFARMLALRLRATFDMVEEAAVAPLAQRLARRLLELAQLQPSAMSAAVIPRGREVPLTQEELGHLLGKSRQSIAKQLRLWEQEGLIQTNYGRVFIDDPAAMTAIAYPDGQRRRSARKPAATVSPAFNELQASPSKDIS